MPELKKFLDPLTPFQRMLHIILLVILGCIVFLFIFTTFSAGFPLELMIMPVGLFVAFGVFISWMFRKSLHAYDNWWNSLSDAEHAEIEQDFRNATQISYYLISGTRYAFIRTAGRVLPYERFDHIEFVRGKNRRCYMHIYIKNGKKIFVSLPSFTEGEQLHDDLLINCPARDGMG